MSRILNEDGRYEPSEPEDLSGVVPLADAEGLPQTEPDRYAKVDVTDFEDALHLDKTQALTMAAIAQSRGMNDVAMRWKQVAMERQKAEELSQARERLEQLLATNPASVPPYGSTIVQAQGASPWESNAQYRQLKQRQADAMADVNDMSPRDSSFFEATSEANRLSDELAALKQSIRDKAVENGTWSQMDDLMASAQASVADKGAQVEAMLRGGSG